MINLVLLNLTIASWLLPFLPTTADKILASDLIDLVVEEPLGGAHRNYDLTAETIKNELVRHLADLQSQPITSLLDERYKRIMSYGM